MNLAVFLPNWVGDVVMATPALRALRRRYPSDRIVGVLRPYVAQVLEGSSWLDKQILADAEGWFGWLRTALQLRREQIDVAVLLTNSFRAALIARLAGCRRRIGYSRDKRSWLLTDRVAPKRDLRGRFVPSPIIDAYLMLTARAGCPFAGYRLEQFTTASDEAAADAVWERFELDKYPEVVCLNTGAAFGSAKCWPLESFARLAQHLADTRGCGVLVLCGPNERDDARNIAQMARRPGVHCLADEPLSIGLTKACIRRADLLVTTDSGPRHFASAFDCPAITLFGPTHIAWTETYDANAVHLQKKVECGPCQLRVCPLDHRCMKLLTPEDVFQAAVASLDRDGKRGTEERRKAS